MNATRVDEVMASAVDLWQIMHPERILSIDPYDRYRTVLLESPAPVLDDLIEAFSEGSSESALEAMSVDEMRAIMLLVFEEANRLLRQGKRYADQTPAERLAFSYSVLDRLKHVLRPETVAAMRCAVTADYKAATKMDGSGNWWFLDRIVAKMH